MKNRATFWLIVRGVALIAIGYLAAAGMTLFCLPGFRAAERASGFSLRAGPDVFYWAMFALMMVWLVVAAIFAWRNRTPLGLAFVVIAFGVFALSANNVLRLAYPVCNAM